MGTFNFSNMQGGQQQETQNIPREFRPAVEQAKTEPVGSYSNNKTGFWDGVKNFFSGADVDTSAAVIPAAANSFFHTFFMRVFLSALPVNYTLLMSLKF